MLKTIVKYILAGMAISLGCCMYLLTSNPFVGALLFACGLLCVRIYKLNLFTGKTQFMVTTQYKWWYYILVLFFNLLGVIFMAVITINITHDAAAPIAITKAAQPFTIALTKGVCCGMLMSLATYEKSPLWMCLLCVPGFILAGFNHCIADAYYAAAGLKIGLPFLATVIGNICGGIFLSGLCMDE